MRRLNPFSSSRDRVAQEPPSPGSTNGKTTAETARPQPETATPQPLSQAPKRAATHGAAKSNQSILASARKTFASLQKKLPSMHLRSSPLRPGGASPMPTSCTTPVAERNRPQQAHAPQLRHDAQRQPHAPLAANPTRAQWPQPQRNASPRPAPMTPVATPDRRPQTQTHAPQQRLDTPQHQPAPQATNPTRAQWSQSQRTASTPRPAPIKPGPIPAASPPQLTRPSLRSLNREIAQLSKQCHATRMRLFEEDSEPTTQEQRLFDTRAALIAQRNQVRDSQLNTLLHTLAPLEQVPAPRTTTSWLANVQSDVIQSNRRALLKARQQLGDTPDIAKHYARARRRLASLQESGADPGQVKRLERMMKGYENLLELEDIVKRTDDQLERMGGPRLMDSIPTTPQERRQRHRDEVDAHQEAIDNGYF